MNRRDRVGDRGGCVYQSKKEGKVQESIHSSTTPDQDDLERKRTSLLVLSYTHLSKSCPELCLVLKTKDKWWLNEGRKYCRILHLQRFKILLTHIKRK